MKDKILVICYSFPPHPGIGGRRWAKFCKILSLKGYEIFIVGATNISKDISAWNKDVDTNKLKINAFNFKFQKVLKYPKNVTNKILRKFLLFFISKTRYNQHIITSLPNKKVWKNVKKIISENQINKVIVSGDPYLFYYASLLKKEIDFELILDYRDLWNDHSFFGKIIKLSKAQQNYFEFAENYAVNNCNKLIFVDEHLEQVVKKRIKSSIPTFIIHNGFDKDDLVESAFEKNINAKINVFFGGSVATDLNNLLFEFVLALEKLFQTNIEMYNKFSISIYGEIDFIIMEKIKEINLPGFFIENNKTTIDSYYKQLRNADAGIVILSDEYKNSYITKFTDYLLYNVFTIAIGNRGQFAEYIEKNNIGISFNYNNSEHFFENLYQKLITQSKLAEKEKEKFELEFLTNKLIREVLEN